MKLMRMPYEPSAVVDFFEEALTAAGALCSRTWHNRLEVLAEGPVAKLWNTDGSLHSVELEFVAANASNARDAAKEIFPGCPLTFRLAESLRPTPLALERVALGATPTTRAPEPLVAEKLWRNQFPDTTQWRQTAAFAADYHFSLVALARCEFQAIDQQWTLHRVALSLPDGGIDDSLAREIGFARPDPSLHAAIPWPTPNPTAWTALLAKGFEKELATELAEVRRRQENRLRREIERIDEYFDHYELELSERASRSDSAKIRIADRLAAARAERARHRADQLGRHEIMVNPHLDSLLLVAEPAWRASLQVNRAHAPTATVTARFVPRSRRWETES